MDFDKKYWSNGEFTLNGNPYNGYVGIYDDNPYVYDTEEPLKSNLTYFSKINSSSNKYFDRVLGEDLELPYKKEDIVFAPNDFLYSSTVKTLVERLEENNNYLFRNAIVGNSILPYNNNISILASEDYNEYYFNYTDLEGNPAVSSKTATCFVDDLDKNGIIHINEGDEFVGYASYIINENCTNGIDFDNILLAIDGMTAEEVYMSAYNGKNTENYLLPRVEVKNFINDGVLKRYSFNEKGLSTKTQGDKYFYPRVGLKEVVSAKSVGGIFEDNISLNTIYIDNEDRTPEKLRFEYDRSLSNKELYNIINNTRIDIDDEDIRDISQDLAHAQINANCILNKASRYYDFLSGEFDTITTLKEPVSLIIDYEDLISLWESHRKTYINNENDLSLALENFNLSINKISIIAKSEKVPSLIFDNGTSTVGEALHNTSYYIGDGFYNITYYYGENSNVKPRFVPVTGPGMAPHWIINFTLDKTIETVFKEGNIKFALTLNIGTADDNIKSYKLIPLITRKRNYRWRWVDMADATNGKITDSIIRTETLPTLTYGYLKESPDWLNATAPRLIYYTEEEAADGGIILFNNNKILSYTPSDDMTAEDCYIFMTNNIRSYRNFPHVARETNYAFISNEGAEINRKAGDYAPAYNEITWVENHSYKKTRYNAELYSFVENEETGEETIEKTFKSAEVAYNELNDAGSINNKRYFDKIPQLNIVTTSEVSSTPVHNFSEITNAEMIIRDVVTTEEGLTYADVLLFLVFKTKVLIIQLKHYIDEAAGLNFKFDNIIDLREGEDKKYLEINCIDYNNTNSLKFKNLSDIKIHKNMLYLTDSDLNLVARYDIDYLIDPGEELSFKLESIKLLDVLQGDGNIKNKICFNNPYSIDASDDKVYIVDRGNKCVKVYSPSLNYIKMLKNGYYASHDIQAVAVNPYPVTLNDGTAIKKDSVWIYSVSGSGLFLSIIDNDEVVSYNRVKDISFIDDKYTWKEEIKNVKFSVSNSNYIYVATTKRVYKFHSSNPFLAVGTLSYFNQRSLLSTTVWGRMHYKWTKIPRIYSSFSDNNVVENEVTWSYRPPVSSAEILDNRCFALCGVDWIDKQFEGDLIFHLGTLYDDNKVVRYIKANNSKFKGQMTFNDIPTGELVSMIKAFNMAFYIEPDSYISSLNDNKIGIYNDIVSVKTLEDYINALTFNKLIYSVVYNLIGIKNQLIGTFKAATNIDGIIVYDNMLFSNYFKELEMGNESSYFVHENEQVSIVMNRVFENIYNIQKKILEQMQTHFMAAPSFTNNTSRII